MTRPDDHGSPALSSTHGVCAGPNGGVSAVGAYDWNFCWKVWDSLQDCAYMTRTPLRPGQHAATSVQRPLERRRGRPASDDSGRGTTAPVST